MGHQDREAYRSAIMFIAAFACLLLLMAFASRSAAAQFDDPTPAALDASLAGDAYLVRPGDTLSNLAARFGITTNALAAANGITETDLIFVGQTLQVPSSSLTPPAAAPPQIAETSAARLGVTAYFGQANITQVIDELMTLGAQWVKIDVYWRNIEPEREAYAFTELDAEVRALRDAGRQILLTVSAAPTWARSRIDEAGPPDSFADFATFAHVLAERYREQVQAYQIWDEPNLRRNWNSAVHSISAASYIEILRLGYEAVKAGDPSAAVISAGLAPTGFDDGVNAINDRQFLRDLYANGLAAYSDAVGINPVGYANPPDARCCAASTGVETHFQDRSFYFLDTLEDYRQIMIQSGDADTLLWITKLGWGTSEDTPPPSPTNIFYSYTSLDEQSQYTVRALELWAGSSYLGPLFLYNLNGCTAQPENAETCASSLIAPKGDARPVYFAVSDWVRLATAP